jgi:nitroimidazol reductase NimA-like FMN-containing flavoprotein (pyridoxamine 5'-phosphate oxidase superfamily)
MNYAYTNGCLYLHCAREGYKLDLIKKNNKVCFQVDIVNPKINKEDERPCEWGMFYKSVIGQGLANIVTDKDEKVKALNAIVATVDSHKYTFSEASVDSVTIIRIDINQITGKKR